MEEKKPTHVRVTMRKSGDEYAMNSTTHSLQHLAPKAFRTKRERVRARRKAAKVQGW